jgi:hypothetical protein
MLERLGGLNPIWMARAELPTFTLKGPEQAYVILFYRRRLATLCLH